MNIIQMNLDHLASTQEELEDEKIKLLKRLSEIYAEEVRLRAVEDVLRITSHFELKHEDSMPGM